MLNKESIISLRKVRLSPEEKEKMFTTLSRYASQNPPVEVESSWSVFIKLMVRFLRGDFFLRS